MLGKEQNIKEYKDINKKRKENKNNKRLKMFRRVVELSFDKEWTTEEVEINRRNVSPI